MLQSKQVTEQDEVKGTEVETSYVGQIDPRYIGVTSRSETHVQQDEFSTPCYRKKESLGKYYPGRTASSSKQKEHYNEKEHNTGKTCRVTFRVVVAPEYQLCLPEDTVVVQFEHTQLGGFGCTDHVMALERTEIDNTHTFHVMQLAIDLPKGWIHSGVSFHYIYGVFRKGRLEGELLRKSDEVKKRRLQFSTVDNFSVPDIWTQNDGMIQPEPEKSSWYSCFNENLYSIQTATMLMPRWEGFMNVSTLPDINMMDAVNDILHLHMTISPLFVKRYNRQQDEPNPFVQALQNYFYGPITRLKYHQHQCQNGMKLSGKDKVLDILTSLAIIYLTVHFKMMSKDSEMNQAMLWAFVVEPDNETKACPEYTEVLEKHIKGHERMFADALLTFCTELCTGAYKYESAWLFAVPMLHFLKGESSPFQKLPESSKNQLGCVWGVQSIDKPVGEYRKQKREMPIVLYLKYLPPMFKLDPLLPRTLLAVMSPHHFQQLFKMEHFPPEAVLAAYCYSIQTTRWFPNSDNDISDFIQPVISMLEKQLKVVAKDMKYDLEEAQAVVTIAHDFVYNAVCKLDAEKYLIASAITRLGVVSIDRMAALVVSHQEEFTESKVDIGFWQKSLLDSVKKLAKVLTDWLSNKLAKQMTGVVCKSTYSETTYTVLLQDRLELKIFSWLVTVKFQQNEEANTFWTDKFLESLRDRLKSAKNQKKIELLWVLTSDDCDPLITEEIKNYVS